MKRRNVDATKARRPIKKIPKIYDGVYSSRIVVYVKLVLLWMAVMGGDFFLDFRLEYLYPIYLLLHNAYEAYKFQGVAFALLLVCIVVSVDVICLGVVPLPWLYLLGSLAVWGQVGWNLTPLGPLLLLPTILYLDGKSIRPAPSQPLSPLAAHCVGFPLVSLGFAVKSFLGSKLKQRTRNDVARQNNFLFSVMWDALPNLPSPPVLPPPSFEDKLTEVESAGNGNGILPGVVTNGAAVLVKKSPPTTRRKSIESNGDVSHSKLEEREPTSLHQNHNVQNGKSSTGTGAALNNHHNHLPTNHNASPSQQYATPCPTCAAALLAPKKKKEECCIKLESEVRRLRSDLHTVRSVESDLRSQISVIQNSERNLRGDVALMQGEHEALQLKYSALLSKSQEERQSYEKKLMEERRQKDNAIKKQTKASQDCSGDCKRKLRDADREKETLRREIKVAEDKIIRLERELQNVKSTLMLEQKNKEASAETAKLMSLLTALQDQNAHLESSLSAETRLKLDLFSALGEARRQLSIRDAVLKSKEDDLEEIRSKYVELLAVSDFTSHLNHSLSSPRQPISPPPVSQHQQVNQQPQTRLKSLMSVVENGPQSPANSRENLTFSPLIES